VDAGTYQQVLELQKTAKLGMVGGNHESNIGHGVNEMSLGDLNKEITKERRGSVGL
jgi:hypothetical protein